MRHQDTEKEKGTNANVIAILCTECGYNESVFLIDYLEDIFKDWIDVEEKVALKNLMDTIPPITYEELTG